MDLSLSRKITNLDLVHNVETVLVALIREGDLDQCIDQAVCVVCRSGKGIAEVGARVGDGSVASEDHKTSDANATWGEQDFFMRRT